VSGVHPGTGVTGRFTGIPGVRFTGILTTVIILTGIITITLIIATGIITVTHAIEVITMPVSELILRR
jgi:hypothetical protein